ncbi:MAG TPA: hypothetical protein PLZ57_03645 [Pseudobdellovibrionaceae bacterium]|nr:hypothetical protein [Pseudobdellovibrionaceae bacterium]
MASLLLISLIALRGYSLDEAPQGFYLDEAAIAAQSICIAETGRTADQSFRLFAPVLGSGYATPITLWVSALWVKISGAQIESFRALAALMGLIGLIAIAWAAQLWRGRSLTWPLAGAMLLTSPWMFHLSRIYWDPIFAFALWSITLALWAAWRAQPTWKKAGLIGLIAALSMLTYPPFRIGVPLSLIVMFFPFTKTHNPNFTRRDLAALTLGGALGLLPLLSVLDEPGFWSRGDFLAIWSQHHLTQTQSQLQDLPLMFLENLARHFDPRFLLFRGDENLRHSTGFGGLLQPAELISVMALLVFSARRWPRPEMRILLLIVVGFIPAALTWEGLPHALRGLMAAPAFLLAAVLGAELIVEKWSAHRIGLIALSLMIGAFFVPYARDYFKRYSHYSQLFYETDTIAHWRKTGEWLKPEEALAHLYFKLSEEQQSCREATATD